MKGIDILEAESRGCFEFFWTEANVDRNSKGYGLIRDRAPGNPNMSSIASVGFGLSAIVIGAERKWISYDEAYERVLGTLQTFLYNAEHINGFFYHFLNMNNAARFDGCEISVIDTAILICGMITAAEYFKGEAWELAEKIYLRVNWNWYVDNKRKLYYMGYHPEVGHFGEWNCYAEQFMMYFLGAASPTYPIDPQLFYSFDRDFEGDGAPMDLIYTPIGSLFTYQFSHAWFDLRDTVDNKGHDWWNNSVLATEANQQFCNDHSNKFNTFNQYSWGLTACDGPYGYCGEYGAAPHRSKNPLAFTDGTVPPCGAAGSIAFTPDMSIDALEHMYNSFPKLWGKYGFKDAYNLDVKPHWYANDYIGIDKGISLLMIENYRTGFIWRVFMENEYARLGMERCGIKSKELNIAS